MPQTIKGKALTMEETNKMSTPQLKTLDKRIAVERAALNRTNNVTSDLAQGLNRVVLKVPFVGKPISRLIDKEIKTLNTGYEKRDDDLRRTQINIPYNYTPDYKGQSFSSHLMGIKPSRKK
jgi:hypothetical protein